MTSRHRWLVGIVTAVVVVAAGVAWETTRDRSVPVRGTALGRLVTREVTAPANTRVRV